MAKNRTMQQKNLINRKRAMKEARERRWDIMRDEYKDNNDYIAQESLYEGNSNHHKAHNPHLYHVPTIKVKNPCKKTGFNPYKTMHEDINGKVCYEII